MMIGKGIQSIIVDGLKVKKIASHYIWQLSRFKDSKLNSRCVFRMDLNT